MELSDGNVINPDCVRYIQSGHDDEGKTKITFNDGWIMRIDKADANTLRSIIIGKNHGMCLLARRS